MVTTGWIQVVIAHLDRTCALRPIIITNTPSDIALAETVDQLPQIILLGQLHSFILCAKHPKALEFATQNTADPKESEDKQQRTIVYQQMKIIIVKGYEISLQTSSGKSWESSICLVL